MTANRKHPTKYSVTFREDEIKALAEMLTLLLRGADVGVLMRSEPLRRVAKKVQMAAKRDYKGLSTMIIACRP